MKRTLLFNLTTAILFISCSTVKLSTEITCKQLGCPPGTKLIADNLYYDQDDVRNLDYLEFLHWTKIIYGANSNEYRTILPDTNQWKKISGKSTSLDTFYLKHPAYREFPVLGVSSKQAVKFSKWRSDRVMEYTLIKYGILNYKPVIPKDSIFTIEKYFAGQYYNVKPNPNILFYPEYGTLDSISNTNTGFRNICTYKKWK